jgi:putative peptidoglycan lipid II flippase
MFIAIPATVGLIVLATPIVRTLFERGQFGASSTELTANLVPLAALGLVATGANVVLSRCSFACREVRWTVAISVLAVGINVGLSLAWLGPFGARGLLGANAVSQTIQAVLLCALVWRLLGGFDLRALARSAGGALLCSAAMVAALRWIATFTVEPGHPFGVEALYLAGQLFIGALAFIAVARLLNVDEYALIVRLIVQKFERSIPSAPESRDAPIA